MNEEKLQAMRHSAAHVLASAVKRKWPEAKFGVGPVIENGFYYDIDVSGVRKTAASSGSADSSRSDSSSGDVANAISSSSDSTSESNKSDPANTAVSRTTELRGDARISEENFKGLEKEMRKIIGEDQAFEHSTMPINEAIKWAQESNQPYKEELLNDLKTSGTTDAKVLAEIQGSDSDRAPSSENLASETNEVGFYTNGDFKDLCRGPHVESTGKIGAFKLMKVAGAYWRGNENNPQMQRVYGVAFETKEQLDEHLHMLEEALKRDHRKLGKELDLFVTSDLVGSGLPMFTPRGTWLRELLGNYSQSLRAKRGFERVWSPNMTKHELYEKSGHWEKFGDELFLVESQETSDKLVLKPMNCPHHTRIYESQPRSYRDLPIRYMENTTDYRDEKSGELHGLSRVRSLTQDDSHVFCTNEQIEQEATALVQAAQEMYAELGMKLKFRLSFRDESESYLGDEKLWEKAQEQIVSLAKNNDLDYYIEEGEAAFYGPKIDFMVTDAIGREWQTATVQIDFVQPSKERFNLEYTTADGGKENPVMIHCALLGTIERFLSVYIEHTAGRFPFWVAPEQVRVLTINDQMGDYVKQITDQMDEVVLMKPLKYNELRYSVDDRNESLGKKISEAEREKIPVLMIVGPKDAEAKQVSVRHNGDEQKVKLSELADWLTKL